MIFSVFLLKRDFDWIRSGTRPRPRVPHDLPQGLDHAGHLRPLQRLRWATPIGSSSSSLIKNSPPSDYENERVLVIGAVLLFLFFSFFFVFCLFFFFVRSVVFQRFFFSIRLTSIVFLFNEQILIMDLFLYQHANREIDGGKKRGRVSIDVAIDGDDLNSLKGRPHEIDDR